MVTTPTPLAILAMQAKHMQNLAAAIRPHVAAHRAAGVSLNLDCAAGYLDVVETSAKLLCDYLTFARVGTPAPARTCGHSACSQHYIDTGSNECVVLTDGDRLQAEEAASRG